MTYADAPSYIAHTDDVTTNDQWNVLDPEGNPLTINIQTDTVTINGTTYYNSSKVDELISGVRSWATSQFEPKSGG